MWSPMSSVSSIDPEGILKACMKKVLMRIASTSATITASAISLKWPFLAFSCFFDFSSVVVISSAYLQDRKEGFLGQFHPAYLLHPLFSFFLLFQKLSFP